MTEVQLPTIGALAKFIWGEDRLKRRVQILRALSKNPIFLRGADLAGLGRKDYYAHQAQVAKELIEVWFQNKWSKEHFLEAGRMIGDVPCYGQFRIFLKNIEAQMSPEQQAYWVPKAQRFEIIGAYAQTELGHGSNLHRIETTATFDEKSDEFVLNSSTLSSSKFWIGALCCWATHAIVVARLIIRGKEYGNHLFMVQVRDLATHELKPNITIYDQGDKAMAMMAGIDNGVMRFSDHRIPRSHLFAGHCSVARDGTYTKPKSNKHSLTSMVIIRGMLADELGLDTMKALFIATRYVQFRRQFGADSPSQPETRVIEYASVKYRLHPAISRAVACMLVGRDVQQRVFQHLSTQMENLHLETVGAKVYASEHGARATEIARLVCGGHGCLASANLGPSYAALSASRTYEGESHVISLQIGRAVWKHWTNGSEDSLPAVSYLKRARSKTLLQEQLRLSGSWRDPGVQERVIETRAAILAQRHLQDTSKGRDTSYHVLPLTLAHGDLTYWRNFRAQLSQAPEESVPALTCLFQVFALSTIEDGLSTFAGTQYLSEFEIESLRTERETAIYDFDEHLETILGAYSFTDFETASTLARSDLNPYEAIMERVYKNPMSDIRHILPTLKSVREVYKKYPPRNIMPRATL